MDSQITKYKEVNETIQLLLRFVKDILEDQFIGMYIHGSLALGDFNPKSSDIDFLIVTKDTLSREIFNFLEKMHSNISTKMHSNISTKRNKWANKLEGSYVSKQLLINREPPSEPRPYANEGRFSLAHYGYEWILEQYITREYGIIIEGPDPKNIINVISPEELKKASLALLNDWWVPMLTDITRLKESHYQPYAILTMCRTLYMFRYGTVVSKKRAAEWAQATFDKEWKILIEKAMKWENGSHFENLEETKDFIRFTLEYTSN